MRTPIALSTLALLAGCAAMGGGGMAADVHTITVRGPDGATVGTALLRPGTDGVQVTLSVNGLPPGTHGMHLHQAGRCDGPDFTSAGGHLNPAGKQHGLQNPQGPHAGDLPNLVVDANRRGSLTGTARGTTLEGGAANSLRKPGGTALVVHASADDQVTDPSGNSGARIACGVIQADD
ncbi:MAG TPA: superoxide dismutase family protein [Longimicrobium sp.]